jgi:nicotinate-nucleotide pyrophosphorylase (carboxylating)
MIEKDHVTTLIKLALDEDLANGIDITSTATIAEKSESLAYFRTKQSGVIAGIEVTVEVFNLCGVEDISFNFSDGDFVEANSIIGEVKGNTRKILLAERTALNFLGKLSGIATLTDKWVKSVAKTRTKIRDTRKTTPGYRQLEKYAVRMGGGINHRVSLSSSALIKDNHISAAGSVTKAFHAVVDQFPDVTVEVEVDTLSQLEEALAAGATFILLDNMSVEETKKAVEIVANRAKLESSGGLSLESARDYAEAGVDFLAVGALTHSAPVLDISLDFSENQ